MVDVTLDHIGHEQQGYVVERGLWNKVKTIMEKRRRKKRRAGNGSYSLSNVLYCSCGRPLYAQKKGNNIRYWCRASPNQQTECKGWGVKESDILPAIIQLVDGELWKSRQSTPPVPQKTDHASKRIAKLDSTIESLKERIKTADLDAVMSLYDAIENAVKRRREIVQPDLTETFRRHQDAVDRWEEITKPTLIEIRTTDQQKTLNRLAPLFPHWEQDHIQQLAEEADRLFNTVHVEPTAVRSVLNDLDCRVDFTFKARHEGKRRYWDVDTARVQIGENRVFDLPNKTSPVHRADERSGTTKNPFSQT